MWGNAYDLSWNDIVEYDCLLNFNYFKKEEESEKGSSTENPNINADKVCCFLH